MSETLNDTSSTLSLLATRRSGKPRDMVAPGPSPDQLRTILAAAIRTPDHGKLNPWRFVIVGDDQRDRLSRLIVGAYRVEKPEAGRLEIEAMDAFARQAPTLIVALSSPSVESSIPLWEQQLSAGAAIMNLLLAAHATGFVGAWLTGWAAYSDAVRNAFGGPDERIAGFIFLGSAAQPIEERPRPDRDTVIRRWS